MPFNNPILFYPQFMNRTFALRAFNKYETEINQHYWLYKVIGVYCRYIAEGQKYNDPLHQTANLFKANGSDSYRIPQIVTDWIAAQKKLENWMRLCALVSALSYLEVYIKQVVNSAFQADPLRGLRLPSHIEVAYALKYGFMPDFDEVLKGFTKGTWEQRTGYFKHFFGFCPETLSQNMAKFESMRSMRNNFAHGFERDLNTPEPTTQSPSETDRLSRETLKSNLGKISLLAKEIDRHLRDTFIGNFEIVYYYHCIRDEPVQREDRDKSAFDIFKQKINRYANVAISNTNAKKIAFYYESV